MIAGHWPIYPLPSPSFDLKISCLKLIVAFILHIGFHLKWERKKGNLPNKFFLQWPEAKYIENILNTSVPKLKGTCSRRSKG